MEVDIQKKFYQKTKVLEDNVTHVVDETPHTMYSLNIQKNYFTEDAAEAIKEIIQDLEFVTKDLKMELEKHTKNKEKGEEDLKHKIEECERDEK
jgi:hypothetical protein